MSKVQIFYEVLDDNMKVIYISDDIEKVMIVVAE